LAVAQPESSANFGFQSHTPDGFPREDVGSLVKKSQKSYIDEKYGVEEAKKDTPSGTS